MKLEKVRLKEARILTEGTKYDKQAAKILADSGLFDAETSENIINALFREDIHAFVHAPNWLEKYLKGIARMIVEEAKGDKNKAREFLMECPSVFDEYLTWIRETRDKIEDQKEKEKLDAEFVNNMHYQDVKDTLEDIQAQRDEQSRQELANMKFKQSDYTLVPIDSYKQMHDTYGGRWTGDGSSDKYAGGGGTAWCHTNNEGVYDSWTRGGNKFFILQHNDWKDIPFNPTTNKEEKGKDAYGNSLIALLVSPKGKLQKATLRCNHTGVPDLADNQYRTYSELSKLAGFNVEDEMKKYYDIKPFDMKELFKVDSNGVMYRNNEYYQEWSEECGEITKVVVPDGVVALGESVFYGFNALKQIQLPSSLKIIGAEAFFNCSSLENIDLQGIEVIENTAFRNCSGLTTVTLPSSLTTFGSGVFNNCYNLKSVNIECSLTELPSNTFSYCGSLESITLPETLELIGNAALNGTNIKEITVPNNIKIIADNTFASCRNLEKVNLPEGLKSIGRSAFDTTPSLTELNIPAGVDVIGPNAFQDSGIKHINLPAGLKTISKYMFNNSYISEIEIPDGVESIGERAFQSSHLKNVTIPSSVKSIEAGAFYYCPLEGTLKLPEGLNTIEDFAFGGCRYLNEIEVPNSVSKIVGNPFEYAVTIRTDNPYVIEYCINKGITVISENQPKGKPYVIYTKDDYLGKYGDEDVSFEEFMEQALKEIYKKLSFVKVDDNTYKILGRNFVDASKLQTILKHITSGNREGGYEVEYEQEGANESLSSNKKTEQLQEKIVKKGSKYQVQSEKGRNLGTYDTKEEAEKRLKQVEYFKHKDNIKEAVQDQPLKSNGIYSVKENKWIKEPVQTDIPDIDYDAFEEQFKVWEDKYFDLVEDTAMSNEEKIEAIEKLIEDLYKLRKDGLAKDGEYSIQNLVFKEARNLGYLDNLKDLKNALKSKELSLE